MSAILNVSTIVINEPMRKLENVLVSRDGTIYIKMTSVSFVILSKSF
jgi:hypothetical protein